MRITILSHVKPRAHIVLHYVHRRCSGVRQYLAITIAITTVRGYSSYMMNYLDRDN
jgi:hypothetical protein